MFKCNPMYFYDPKLKVIEVPDVLVEFKDDFENYIRFKDNNKIVNLNYVKLN